jgi:hypothetical protein
MCSSFSAGKKLAIVLVLIGHKILSILFLPERKEKKTVAVMTELLILFPVSAYAPLWNADG